MTDKEKKLASYFLELASDEFSNHGCNDVEKEVFKDWTIEEHRQLVKEFHEYNGDIEEYNPDFLHLPDFAIMSFLAHKMNINL